MQQLSQEQRIRALSECVHGCASIIINQMRELRRGGEVSWKEIQDAIDGLQRDTNRMRELMVERAQDRQV